MEKLPPLKDVISRHQLRAKKSLGQNFLVDQNILTKISYLINSENLKILEIGPGDGRLTDKIILKKRSFF